jgi:predicted N-acetyltransferase YhbS
MTIAIRPADPADSAALGHVLFSAFATLADQHGFARDFPSADVARGIVAEIIAHPGFAGFVAEQDGQVLGSVFADMRSPIFGIGPISVDPATQNKGVGAALMRAMMDAAVARDAPGIRLLQAAYHNRSLCLYTRLGFRTREPLSLMQGAPVRARFPGYDVRQATAADAPACNALCHAVHGLARAGELADATAKGQARVVEHLGRVAGYATGIGFRSHAVTESNAALKALISAAGSFPGPGFLVPARNHEIFAWCLDNGLRLVMQMTLMTIGLYNEPTGGWMPSILY